MRLSKHSKKEIKILNSSAGSSQTNYNVDIEEFDSGQFSKTIPISARFHHVRDHPENSHCKGKPYSRQSCPTAPKNHCPIGRRPASIQAQAADQHPDNISFKDKELFVQADSLHEMFELMDRINLLCTADESEDSVNSKGSALSQKNCAQPAG